MSQKPIYEITTKQNFVDTFHNLFPDSELKINFESVEILTENLAKTLDFDKNQKYVVKPDMLFGGRGKLGLVKINISGDKVIQIIQELAQEIEIKNQKDKLNHWIVEKMLVNSGTEFYLNIQTSSLGDKISFSNLGGMEIENNWDKVIEIIASPLKKDYYKLQKLILQKLESTIKAENLDLVSVFITQSLQIFRENNYSYLEFNPFCLVEKQIYLLDAVARVDDQGSNWYGFEFPKSFGQQLITREEKKVLELDAKSGSSLKLTMLNPDASIWCLLAGGGASVVFLDELVRKFEAHEIANYGEYSGNPNKEEVREYTKAILGLMLKSTTENLTLCIVGATANFTMIDVTFAGICVALEDYKLDLILRRVKILARRGGPNYQKGLETLKIKCDQFGLNNQIFGPELLYQDITTYL